MLKVRQVPNPFYVTHEYSIYEGSNGLLYNNSDVELLKSLYPNWKRRKTKYGYTYYFGKEGE